MLWEGENLENKNKINENSKRIRKDVEDESSSLEEEKIENMYVTQRSLETKLDNVVNSVKMYKLLGLGNAGEIEGDDLIEKNIKIITLRDLKFTNNNNLWILIKIYLVTKDLI